MTRTTLPAQFAELDRFVEQWDRPGTNERYAQRVAHSMADLQDFHKNLMARGEEIKSYLDSKPFSKYSEQDTCLARLMFAFSITAGAVEIYKTQVVPDTGTARFDCKVETELTPASPLMSTR